MEKRYGVVAATHPALNGYTLEELNGLANQMRYEEGSLEDAVGDLAVLPAIILDMAEEIISLRAKVESLELASTLAQQTI